MKRIIVLSLICINIFANEADKKGREFVISDYIESEITKQIANNVASKKFQENKEIEEIIIYKEEDNDEIHDNSNAIVKNIPQNEVISIENLKDSEDLY